MAAGEVVVGTTASSPGATGRTAVGEQMGERRPAAGEWESGHRRDGGSERGGGQHFGEVGRRDSGGGRGGGRHYGELARRDRVGGGGRADGGECRIKEAD
ncbi:hypothetical protein [Oryza sativa Japonica Group]|uniref:Uncharacterized protein n=1 Tax=Oryza sativa subsp. japonica TaxID=39947 RepID=Q5JLT9_ORYSJ|nr:hypothetical protein [Oryza sativa Japonica Group]